MPKKPISIERLLVNPENPRFEPVKNQQAAIDLMLAEVGKEVLNLAEDIAKHGLNPSKSLMVVEIEKDHFLPLEGNRRVVALKLLHNPELAKDNKFVELFKTLKKEHGTQIPTQMECAIFPDKESAFRWVNLEHTGENKGVGVLRWDSEQRQRFIAQYAGKKPSRSIQLFDFADQNNLNHEKVDSTTLDRIVTTPFVREQIGISFPQSLLDLEKPKNKVISNLRKIFAAMSKKEFKVGDVYTNTHRKDWIKNILGISDKNKGAEETPQGAKAKGGPLDGDWITHQLYSAYPIKNRIKSILKELKDLNPKQKPNICATSLRVLLELAVYVFLKEKKKIKAMIDQKKQRVIEENKKRSNKREWDKDWSPNFQRTLDYMATEENIITDPLERKALKTFIGKKSNEPFLLELNQFIHNPDYEPSPEMVIEIWNKLGKLIFKTILSG